MITEKNMLFQMAENKLNCRSCVKVQPFTHLPPLLWPFEPHSFFQLYTNSSSLAIPAQVLKSN